MCAKRETNELNVFSFFCKSVGPEDGRKFFLI